MFAFRNKLQKSWTDYEADAIDDHKKCQIYTFIQS